MWKVYSLFSTDGCVLTRLDMKTSKPIDIVNMIKPQLRYYIGVQGSDTSSAVVDFTKLLADNKIKLAKSWVQQGKLLTDELVLGYKVDNFPLLSSGTYKHPLRAIPVLCRTDMTVGYCDYVSGVKDCRGLNAYLNDIYIESHNEDIDPHRVLVSINGFLHTLKVGNEERNDPDTIYVVNGCELCRSESYPEIVLLDFTHFGDIVLLPTSLTKKSKSVHITSTTWDPDRKPTIRQHSILKFSLPEGYSFTEYAPIVVLNGVPILPDKGKCVSDTIYELSLVSFPIRGADIEYRIGTSDYDDEYERIILSDTFVEITKNLTEDIRTEKNFVVLVPKCTVERITVSGALNSIMTEHDGLLVSKLTGMVVDHITNKLDKRNELIKSLNHVTSIPDVEKNTTTIGIDGWDKYEQPDYMHTDRYEIVKVGAYANRHNT